MRLLTVAGEFMRLMKGLVFIFMGPCAILPSNIYTVIRLVK